MNLRVREMRDTASLPRAMVTLPDELDNVVAYAMTEMRGQAEEALETGLPHVAIVFRDAEQIRALALWSSERIGFLGELTKAGMVRKAGWEQPLRLVVEFLDTTQ
jgi:hypothetical protein